MSRTEKLWGVTVELTTTPMCEIHHIRIVDSGYCSWHHHKHKWNAFIVVKGELAIEVEKLGDGDRDVVLKAGDFMAVPPMVNHRFHARRGPVEAYEVYYPQPIGEEDIRRYTTGGIGTTEGVS